MSLQALSKRGDSLAGGRNAAAIGSHLLVAPPARPSSNYPVLRRPNDAQRLSSQQNKQEIIEEKSITASRQILTKRYVKGNFLGKGGFAKVYEIRNMELDYPQAVKVVPKSTLVKSRAKQKLQSEIRIHRSMHHPNIVQFENFFEDEENVYIIMELCNNSTLNEQIKRRKRLSELEVQCYGQQILQAIKYMHQHRIIHRDLKLGNLFLTDKMQVKTGDFGLAAKLEFTDEKRRTVCGTPNYIAPEILDQKQGHSFEVDIWSFGVILYALIIGRPPFETSEIKQTYKRIKAIQYSFPDNVPISDEAKDLITKILILDPAKRPTVDQIFDHPFFHMGNQIPKLLPPSALACPLSDAFMKQFQYTPGKMAGQVSKYASQQSLRIGSTPITLPKLHTYGSQLRLKTSEGPKLSLPMKSVLSTKLNKRGPTVWVKKWVDYSSKYGLGYTLSDGTCGVYFNDNSKMLRDNLGKMITYFVRNSASRQEQVDTFPIEESPKELQKKVLLLKHFAEYLEGNKDEFQEESEPENSNQLILPARQSMRGTQRGQFSQKSSVEKMQVIVKKWLRTKHAIMFRLNNKVVQVCFQDNSQIILCSDTRLVTYVNRTGTRQTVSLQEALDSTDYEMVKRLKYTKDIVQSMLDAGGQRWNAPLGENKRPSLQIAQAMID